MSGVGPTAEQLQRQREALDNPSEPKPGKFGGFILSIRYFIFPEFPGRVQEGARSGTGGGAAWNSSVESLGRTLSCGAPRLCAGGTKADCSPAGSLPREGGERGKGTGTPGVPCSSSCPPLGSAGKAPAASVFFFPFWKPGKGGDERGAPIQQEPAHFPSPLLLCGERTPSPELAARALGNAFLARASPPGSFPPSQTCSVTSRRCFVLLPCSTEFFYPTHPLQIIALTSVL